MKLQFGGFSSLVVLLMWLAGIVLAHGFWQTFFTIIIPPYAMYLVVEKVLTLIGWIF